LKIIVEALFYGNGQPITSIQKLANSSTQYNFKSNSKWVSIGKTQKEGKED